MIRKKKQLRQTTKPSHSSDAPVELTFMEHIRELRARLFWVATSLLLTSSIAFVFRDALIGFILAPLHGEKLVYLTIGGGFSFILTICLYFGAVMSIPVIIYHLYRFVQPVLGQTSQRFIISLVLSSAALAVAGAAFGYYVAIQASLDFLMGFADGAITSSVTAESYMNFMIVYTAGLAIVFQLPLLLFMFDHIRPFKPGALLSSQRFVITGAVIAAALITPTPDVVNQMIVAVPIVAIYEIGALLVFMRRIARQRRKIAKPKSVEYKNTQPELDFDDDLLREAAALADKTAVAVSVPTPSVLVASIQPPEPQPQPNRVVVKVPVQATQPTVVSSQPTVGQRPVRRSVDGFTRTSSPSTLRIPGRATTMRPVAISTPPSTTQRTSIDGFPIAQTS